MRFGSFLSLIIVAATGCQPPAPVLEESLGAVNFTGAHPEGAPASAALVFESERQALAPVSLKNSKVVTATAGVELAVDLPVPFSTQGLWARVSSSAITSITVGGQPIELAARPTLVHFPLTAHTLRLTAQQSGELTIAPIAAVDTVGGGFVVQAEATKSITLAGASVRVTDDVTQPDDSFARLVELQLSADADSNVQIGHCGAGSDEPTTVEALIDVRAGKSVTVSAWLPPGPLCFNALTPARVQLTGVGRIRRFATTALRAVKPITVLDTAKGTGGWLGRAGVGQRLEVSLSGLTVPTGATHLLFVATAGAGVTPESEIKVSACDATATALQSGGSTLVPVGQRLCVEASGRFDVSVALVGAVTPRSEDITQCSAKPTEGTCSATDLLGRLNCIPGVTATAYSSPRKPAGTTQYLLRIEQPIDHFHPDGPVFHQRALLTVRSETAPMVLHTTGYELFEYFSDLSSNFPTNELELEHRFFEDSTPDPVDYSVLTVMQSAYDSHRVVELIGPLFNVPWMNTGHSKGGMTALFHRRFFPCDVVASAPYVTPISHSKQDPRFGPWLAELGGPQFSVCRQVVKDLERGVISGRAQYAPTLRGTYQMIGSKENALWAAMSGTSLWAIFQYGYQNDTRQGCPAWEALNGPNLSAYFGDYASYGESYSDQGLTQGTLDAYSYQTQNELGSPGKSRAHLEEFGPIPELPDDAQFLFGDVPVPTFEPRAMADVQQWLSTHGEHFVFLYGGFDPWTAGQVDVTGARDAVKIIVPGENHGVSIADAQEPERESAYTRIEGWLGVQRIAKRAGNAKGERLVQYRDVMHRHRL